MRKDKKIIKTYEPKIDWGWATCNRCIVRFSNANDISQEKARCPRCGGKVNDFSIFM